MDQRTVSRHYKRTVLDSIQSIDLFMELRFLEIEKTPSEMCKSFKKNNPIFIRV